MIRKIAFGLALGGLVTVLSACGREPGTRAVTGGLLGAGTGAGVAAVTGPDRRIDRRRRRGRWRGRYRLLICCGRSASMRSRVPSRCSRGLRSRSAAAVRRGAGVRPLWGAMDARRIFES